MSAPDSLTPDALAALLADPTAAGVIKALATGLGIQPTAASTVPTVREYHPTVLAAATPGTRRTYSTYWNRLVREHGDDRIDAVTTSKLRALAQSARANALRRRNGQGGASAEENCVAALRAFFRCAVEDKYLTDNPAAAVQKPVRPPSQRRALTEPEFRELDEVTRTGGDDPVLDTLLLRFHAETGARRGGALALTLADLDEARLCVRLREKGGKARWQPVSPTLFAALVEHAAVRGARDLDEQVFRYRPRRGEDKGAPLTRRRYNTLADRWQRALPWAAQYGVSPHWLRHTALTAAERVGGSYGIARAYAGHAEPADATTTYIKAGVGDVARVLAAITGEPHPLARS